MDVFGVLALLGLGVALVATMTRRRLAEHGELWHLVFVGTGIGFAWLTGFDMWAQWGLPVREGWVGTTLTGVAIAGFGYVVYELLGFVAGLERKYTDEAASIEKREGLRQAA